MLYSISQKRPKKLLMPVGWSVGSVAVVLRCLRKECELSYIKGKKGKAKDFDVWGQHTNPDVIDDTPKYCMNILFTPRHETRDYIKRW